MNEEYRGSLCLHCNICVNDGTMIAPLVQKHKCYTSNPCNSLIKYFHPTCC